MRQNAESNFLTGGVLVNRWVHEIINLWLFCMKSTYGCFWCNMLKSGEQKISAYGFFNRNTNYGESLFSGSFWVGVREVLIHNVILLRCCCRTGRSYLVFAL